ncbi:hypothetical protein BJV74DRAFT_988043 [Russula compacta]|nr:hypothetical protein BJV74DRAFT_988043 [Russula compacta]
MTLWHRDERTTTRSAARNITAVPAFFTAEPHQCLSCSTATARKKKKKRNLDDRVSGGGLERKETVKRQSPDVSAGGWRWGGFARGLWKGATTEKLNDADHPASSNIRLRRRKPGFELCESPTVIVPYAARARTTCQLKGDGGLATELQGEPENQEKKKKDPTSTGAGISKQMGWGFSFSSFVGAAARKKKKDEIVFHSMMLLEGVSALPPSRNNRSSSGSSAFPQAALGRSRAGVEMDGNLKADRGETFIIMTRHVLKYSEQQKPGCFGEMRLARRRPGPER